jgi:lipoprotein-anchoring transpeptidase ErfK/SrfK
MARILPLLLLVFALYLGINHFWPKNELASQKAVDEVMAATGEFDPNALLGIWNNKSIRVPNKDLLAAVTDTTLQNVLGVTANDNKWIEVDLNNQILYAHDGNLVVMSFPISTGLPWTPTVTGEFRIWAKVRSQRMSGGSVEAGNYYDLPNVPFVQYFYQGYGLHGAYWHNDFGHPRSHGCVNISINDAAKLFYWTEPVIGDQHFLRSDTKNPNGTKVIVHGTTPTQLN